MKYNRDCGQPTQGIQLVESERRSLVARFYFLRHRHLRYSVGGSCGDTQMWHLDLDGLSCCLNFGWVPNATCL
jgi:hypothetical protein